MKGDEKKFIKLLKKYKLFFGFFLRFGTSNIYTQQSSWHLQQGLYRTVTEEFVSSTPEQSNLQHSISSKRRKSEIQPIS